MRKKSYVQVIEYGATHIFTFGLDLLLIWILAVIWGIYYVWALVAGYAIATIINYFWDRGLVFKQTKVGFMGGYFATVGVAVISLFIVILLMALFVQIFGIGLIEARLMTGLITGTFGYILETIFCFKMPLIYRRKRA